jgi:hypothetical protein
MTKFWRNHFYIRPSLKQGSDFTQRYLTTANHQASRVLYFNKNGQRFHTCILTLNAQLSPENHSYSDSFC